MDNSRLIAAEAPNAGNTLRYRSGCDEISVRTRRRAIWRRNHRWTDRSKGKSEATFLIRYRSNSRIHKIRLIARCRGARYATKRRECGRKTVPPSGTISHRRRSQCSDVFAGRSFVRGNARAKQLRDGNGGNDQYYCNYNEEFNQRKPFRVCASTVLRV